jgi:hypothetical protein
LYLLNEKEIASLRRDLRAVALWAIDLLIKFRNTEKLQLFMKISVPWK